MAAPQLEVVNSSGGKRNTIFNSIKRFSLEGLNDLIRVLMESVDDALFDLADKVDNDRDRNMYFEAMREIRLKREGIKQNFDYELQAHFDRFIKGKAAVESIDDGEELTLVELDDLEDAIAIENMVSKARPHFEDELFAVSERLKIILKRDAIEEDDNPLDPKAICESFHNASDLLDTDIQVKLIFYKLFDKYVMNNLGHFYKELNDLFAEKGVLPGFKADQERMKQTTRFMANRIRNSAPQTGGIPMGGEYHTDGVNHIPGGVGVAAGIPGDGNLFAALQQALPAGSAMPDGGTGMAGGGAGVAGGGQVAPGGVAINAGNFLAALTTLQAETISDQPVYKVDPQELKQANQQQLIAFRQANPEQVNSGDSQIIDVVSMLFDFFFDDEALPAPIKVLIGRLQIPILKVAIIDKDFFNHKKHPARKLLDSISKAAMGWGDNPDDERALVAKIERVVDFLLNEFDEDLTAFEYALADFEQFLKQENEEIDKANAEVIENEKAKDEQIQDAQDAAAELINKLIGKRELSYEVVDFLETTWSSVLFGAHLSLGESSNHWKNLKRISTTFVWTLIPKNTEEERVKIIQTIPALLRALSKGMELIKIKTEVQNRIFKMLAQEHAKIVKQTSKNIVTRVDDTTVWPEDNTAEALANAAELDALTEDAGKVEMIVDDSITVISSAPTNEVIDDLNQFTAGVKDGQIQIDEEIVLGSDEDDSFEELVNKEDDEFYKLAKNIEMGTWVEFKESDSRTLVARLSWKSNVTGNLVFVNRQGHKVRNLTVNALAIELRAGRVTSIESSSVFDRAINTIMTTMKH